MSCEVAADRIRLCYLKVAEQLLGSCPGKVTPGRASRPKSAPASVQKLLQEPSGGPNSTKLGRRAQSFGQLWPSSTKLGRFGPSLAKLGQPCPMLVQLSGRVGQTWVKFGQRRPKTSASTVQFRPSSTNLWPSLAKFGQQIGQCGQTWPDLGHLSAAGSTSGLHFGARRAHRG